MLPQSGGLSQVVSDYIYVVSGAERLLVIDLAVPKYVFGWDIVASHQTRYKIYQAVNHRGVISSGIVDKADPDTVLIHTKCVCAYLGAGRPLVAV